MVRILALMLLFNFVSCFLVRRMYGGRLEVSYETLKAGPKVYLIAGIKNWPLTAYQFINFADYAKVDLNFSHLGFNAERAGEQLAKIVAEEDLVCGVSIGAKPIEYAAYQIKGRLLLINPCSHPIALKEPYHSLTRYLSPIAEVISYAIGWLAVLPIIPADLGNHTSFALLIDQLYWIGWGDPNIRVENCGVVISTEDEFLETEVLRNIYDKADKVEIETRHGRTGTKSYGQAEMYNGAVGELLMTE